MTSVRGALFEDLVAVPDDGSRHELVRGEIRQMPPPKGEHGGVEMAVAGAIERYLYGRAVALGWQESDGRAARQRLVGYLGGGEQGIRVSLPDDPDQVRGVDVLYLTPEQYTRHARVLAEEYIPAVPALGPALLREHTGGLASEMDRKASASEKKTPALLFYQRISQPSRRMLASGIGPMMGNLVEWRQKGDDEMVVETQEATRRVTLVAQTPPEKLPQCPEFAWSALLTAQQRQRLQQDARRDLELVAQHVDKHAVDALNRNLLTAAYLLNRPEIAATLPVDWDVADAWFWTPEWQAGEREAEADFAAGRVTRHDSDEEFLAALRGRRAVHADAS